MSTITTPQPVPDLAQARRNMVDNQLRTFDVTDRAVLAAAAAVPRELFMPAGRAGLAYLDQNVEFGAGEALRVTLQPMVVTRMIQALEIESGTRVLDVASGLGYSAALLASLGAEVTALEADETLARDLRERLAQTPDGRRASVATGALAEGQPDLGPFDAILINGAVEGRPEKLLAQLAPSGRLVCLQHEAGATSAMLYVRSGEGTGQRRLFEATAPVLAAFRKPASFRF